MTSTFHEFLLNVKRYALDSVRGITKFNILITDIRASGRDIMKLNIQYILLIANIHALLIERSVKLITLNTMLINTAAFIAQITILVFCWSGIS